MRFQKLTSCTDILIATACRSAESCAKMDADNMCHMKSDATESKGCHCHRHYDTSECYVTHNPDRSCLVTSRYEYAGACDDSTVVPTAAPTPALSCPNKECRGQNKVNVKKSRCSCRSATLKKFCLESQLTAKLLADLECDVEAKCVCQGQYSLS
jgi:hypothetical protein